MHPKPFSSKYVAHGIKYEPTALQEYQKFVFIVRSLSFKIVTELTKASNFA